MQTLFSFAEVIGDKVFLTPHAHVHRDINRFEAVCSYLGIDPDERHSRRAFSGTELIISVEPPSAGAFDSFFGSNLTGLFPIHLSSPKGTVDAYLMKQEGRLYISLGEGKEVEISKDRPAWDVMCAASDCGRPELFPWLLTHLYVTTHTFSKSSAWGQLSFIPSAYVA